MLPSCRQLQLPFVYSCTPANYIRARTHHATALPMCTIRHSNQTSGIMTFPTRAMLGTVPPNDGHEQHGLDFSLTPRNTLPAIAHYMHRCLRPHLVPVLFQRGLVLQVGPARGQAPGLRVDVERAVHAVAPLPDGRADRIALRSHRMR